MQYVKLYLLIGVFVYIPIMLQLIKKDIKDLSLYTLLSILIWFVIIVLGWPLAIPNSLYALYDVLVFWRKR